MRMALKISAFVLLLITTGAILWVGSLMWRSPDYAASGVCSAQEIARTSAKIDEMHMRHDAAHVRVSHEFSKYHPQVRTLRGALERSANTVAFKTWDSENTAAYYCNHAYFRVEGQKPFATLPATVSWLHQHTDEDDAWRLAVCLSYSARSKPFTDGYRAEIPALRRMCETRRSLRIKRGW